MGMERRMAERSWLRIVSGWVGCALIACATGCTMCPDPFDYSGPVPNGSAPQNDFWARSNGILPLHAAPMPWPPVVDGDSARRLPTSVPETEQDVALSSATGEDIQAEQLETPE